MRPPLNKVFVTWLRSVWQSAGIICGILMLVVWVTGLAIIDHLDRTSPRTPAEASGEVVPVQWKTVTVYMTPRDAEFAWWFPMAGLIGFGGAVAFSAWRRMREKSN